MKLFCKVFSLTFIVFYIHLTFAQGSDTLWTKTYGGAGYERAYMVEQTTDGGYIITGYTTSSGAGSADYYLIKTDANGDSLWTRTFGGFAFDEAHTVQQTSDGGYIIIGNTYSYGSGGQDFWLVKTGSSGDTIWTKTFGGVNDEWPRSVEQTTDGGYIITGLTTSFGAGGRDLWLIKTNAAGDTLWTKTHGGTNEDVGSWVRQTKDGGYIIVGWTQSFGAGDQDVWIVKTNASGDAVWTKTYGGAGIDRGHLIERTTDGGYIIAGITRSFSAGLRDFWLIKTNAVGDTLWSKIYGRAGDDESFSVVQTDDGGYLITGWTTSSGAGGRDYLLIRTDDKGDIQWSKTYGGIYDDASWSVQQTSDGGYIIVGYTESFGGGTDIWLLKMGSEPGIEEEKIESVRSGNLSATILSGPLKLPKDKICRVFDITGRVVMPDKIKPGIYFIEIDGEITKKVVKVR